MVTLQMPALPEPVPVTVTAATTALLVFDMVDPICTTQPKCIATMVPAVTSLLAKARSAGVFVLYATRGPTLSKWITQIAPTVGDPVMQSYAQDRFYNTDLDKTLKDKGIKTLILAGWKVSGSVTYTSVGATARGYNVVVPQDASLATTDYETAIGIFQILNQFDANATNEPLKAKASTLSRTDMITIQ
jgi:nicotinamidase-related amidase